MQKIESQRVLEVPIHAKIDILWNMHTADFVCDRSQAEDWVSVGEGCETKCDEQNVLSYHNMDCGQWRTDLKLQCHGRG